MITLNEQNEISTSTGNELATSPPQARNLDAQQEAAFALIQSGENVFLSGMAGTGKSYLIQQVVGASFRAVDMCATTGIAALNLQQSIRERTGIHIPSFTIYRYAGIGLGPANGQSNTDFYNFLTKNPSRTVINAMRRIRKAECIVIDEISMLPGRILEFLDFWFRRCRENMSPFGGVQIVAVGDFLQLPPVSKTGKYDWAFLSPAWKLANFRNCYLTQIHRQNERVFIEVLNDFREGRVRGQTAEILQRRTPLFPSKNIPRLFTHNIMVDKFNRAMMEAIPEEERAFDAETSGADFEVDFLVKNLVTPAHLVVKIGARVMFTANISRAGQMLAANGECGTVIGYESDMHGRECPSVQKDSGEVVLAEAMTWQFDPQRDDSGKFTQVPLRLAYALTIHKSQGLTMDAAIIDIRAAREPGQAYVAVSRVRTMAGLWLKDKIAGVVVSPDAIQFYLQILTTN